MKLTKEEQLRESFTEILKYNFDDTITIFDLRSIVESLLKEVSIRFYIKGE